MSSPYPPGPARAPGARDAAPVSVAALVLRFAAAGGVALLVLGFATSFISRQVGRSEAVDDARRVTFINAHNVVMPVLDDGVVEMDPVALATLDELVRRIVLQGSLVRVKVWRKDGTIVYSDESRLIGDRFDFDEEELEAFENGSIKAEVSDLSKPENRFENRSNSLLEVYLPIQTKTSGTTVLFEAYFLNDGVSAAGRSVWRKFAPTTIGSLLVLQLVQIPLAWSMARHLQRGQRERERLFANAIAASEGERRRIASDLHDGVVQDISGVSYGLSALARHPGIDAEAQRTVDVSAHQLREIVRSLRSLLVDIYPPNLQAEGLEAAVADLLGRLEGRGITTTLTSDLPPGFRHREEVASLLYRTAQEGLRNIVSHADAANVVVHLGQTPSSWTLRVDDDGRGFDPTTAGVVTSTGHVGLRVVADLIHELGGTLTIESAPSAGTALVVEVPRT